MTSPPSSETVAIVHDYLNQRGGAERVVLELGRMWPRAPLYTSLYRPESTFPEFAEHDIRTSFLDRLPVDRGFRNLFPLYPQAFRSLGPLDAELVVSSSSGWAHMVGTTPGSFHAVYCHTPARWLWGEEYLEASSAKQRAIARARGFLRRFDRRAARRADLYIANSHATRSRIRQAYDIDAAVVHPPVDVDRFKPRPRGERLLVVSRLLPYKRVDVVVDAATLGGVGLDVVGVGPALRTLRERAGPTVTFHGSLDDSAVVELMESCRALCLPGAEDFGIVPVEAQAAGKPVVAFAGGGALETVEAGFSGAFFHEHTPKAVLDALAAVDALDSSPEEIANAARRFSPTGFHRRLAEAIDEARGARMAVIGER